MHNILITMALACLLSELSLLLLVVTHILHIYRAQSITNVQLEREPWRSFSLILLLHTNTLDLQKAQGVLCFKQYLKPESPSVQDWVASIAQDQLVFHSGPPFPYLLQWQSWTGHPKFSLLLFLGTSLYLHPLLVTAWEQLPVCPGALRTYDSRSYCRICLQKSKFVSACSSGGKKKVLSFQGIPVLNRREGQVKSNGNRRLGSWVELELA